MAKYCTNCNQTIKFGMDYLHNGKVVCFECGKKLKEQQKRQEDEEKKKKFEELIAKAPKIKCPFCEQWFSRITEEQYQYSLGGNIARGLVFLPWGVIKAIKNRPYVECPHCKMKIMQG